MTTLYCARWVLPVASEAIADGAVAVEGTRIAGIGERASLESRFPDARVEDFGEAAILPGFVNCHSHLELTAMRGFLEAEEGDFQAWLKKLTLTRMFEMTEDDLAVSATWGVAEAARAGVTCVGDASSAGAASMRALCDVGLRGTVFQEVFGPDAAFAREQLAGLQENVGRLRESATELVRVGVSPHAPYSVSGALYELVADYALDENLLLMTHAAESHDEDLLMREGRGVFAENLAGRGIEWRAPGVSTVQYLAAHGVLRARPLLAHCIRVDDADIQTIRETGARIAHCPKSNAKFGHGRAPFAAFIENRLNVGLGSDSVASNNTADLLEETRFATLISRAGGDTLDDGRMLNATDALRAATEGGARALGLEAEVGTLREGAEADLAVVSLEGVHQLPVYDAARALVFASSGRDVRLTLVAGREIYRDGHVKTVDEERLRARIKEISAKLSRVKT
ncbi:MAG TPA: amidohydrolase family protein [Pyrinomonadaceae bacterium]|jgi:5-methylthioadenosine/S-adenosylhomocysteine deaminase